MLDLRAKYQTEYTRLTIFALLRYICVNFINERNKKKVCNVRDTYHENQDRFRSILRQVLWRLLDERCFTRASLAASLTDFDLKLA